MVRFNPNNRIICVHPNTQGCSALLNLNFSRSQLERLQESCSASKRTWIQGNAHSTDLHQPLIAIHVLIPGIGFANVENQIAVRFHPHVQTNIAIADRSEEHTSELQSLR